MDVPERPKDVDWPIGVLATSKEKGTAFAEKIGLKNYYVVTEMFQTQGLRIVTFVITPGWFRRMERERDKHLEVMDRMVRDSLMTSEPPEWG